MNPGFTMRYLISGCGLRSGTVSLLHSALRLYASSDLLRLIVPVDTLTKTERSERMSRVRARDTGPELIVRRLLHKRGYRYRLHERSLPGSPDLVFKRRRKVIFVHGCFWHQHADPACRLARMPKSRLEFWKPKLEANRNRDFQNQSKLNQIAWEYLVVWECELKHTEQLENRLTSFLEGADGNESD